MMASLPTARALTSASRSSLACAEPRLAMISCRPVRISRAEAAAESGMAGRLSDGEAPRHGLRFKHNTAKRRPAMQEKRIHQIFVVSVSLKGLHALLEIVGGL